MSLDTDSSQLQIEAETIKKKAEAFLQTYASQIDWVVSEFGNNGAGDLELVSTIIYADREAELSGSKSSVHDIASLVNKIKPHFNILQIERKTTELQSRGLLHVAGI